MFPDSQIVSRPDFACRIFATRAANNSYGLSLPIPEHNFLLKGEKVTYKQDFDQGLYIASTCFNQSRKGNYGRREMGVYCNCGGSADVGFYTAGNPVAYPWNGIWTQAYLGYGNQRFGHSNWNNFFPYPRQASIVIPKNRGEMRAAAFTLFASQAVAQ
jgi:hypothetical protein